MSARNARAPAGVAASPWTWLLALVAAFAFDAAITRSGLLWQETAFEHASDPAAAVHAQCYRVARSLYAARSGRGPRVAVLGNSRILLAANAGNLERELGPERARVDVLAVFGGRLGAMEIVSRHLTHADWRLVLLTVAPGDLLWDERADLAEHPIRELEIGWRDGPLPAQDAGERTQRWLRTLWPLLRFRSFARTALEERVAGVRPPAPQSPQLTSPDAVFAHMYGERAAEVAGAHARWRESGGLDAYVRYLEAGQQGYLDGVVARVQDYAPPTPDRLPVRFLEALLERAAAAPFETRVLVMPRNPVLALDRSGRYHAAELEREAFELLSARARAAGVVLVDLRDAMPAAAFLDFDHLMPGLSGFDARLAREIEAALAG